MSTPARPIRTALYLRVSTLEQEPENQRRELATYLEARGWTLTHEYCDHGVSGAKERRPALDELLRDARRRRFDAVAVWSLDRIGRNLRHLIATLEELQQIGVTVVSPQRRPRPVYRSWPAADGRHRRDRAV